MLAGRVTPPSRSALVLEGPYRALNTPRGRLPDSAPVTPYVLKSSAGHGTRAANLAARAEKVALADTRSGWRQISLPMILGASAYGFGTTLGLYALYYVSYVFHRVSR
jgi:hypothetical protein